MYSNQINFTVTGVVIALIAGLSPGSYILYLAAGLLHYAQDLVLPHDEILFAVQFDFLTGILAE